VSQTPHDAIVIGAGVNGLVAAHTLARAGRRVLVLERQSETDAALDVGWVPPQVIKELQLGQQGFKVERPDPWMTVALPNGGRLDLWQDPAKTMQAIRQLSAADAGKWPEFCRRMGRLAGILEAIYQAPPPDVETTNPGELLRLAGLGLKVRGMGKQGMIDLLRVLPMSVAELLDDWFESDALKAVLGAAGVLHLRQGPRSGGTAFNLLHHHVGSPPGVFRSPLSNLSQVLARLPGVEVRRGAPVARVTVQQGRATGVTLASGEEIAAPLVLSSADPRSTLLGLVDPAWLDPEFVRAVRNVKCRGVSARITLMLDRPTGFTALTVAPSLDYLERAYDDAKYGRVSRHPWLEARAEDRRVVVHAQYVPYALADGRWDDARRGILGDVVVALLSQQLPTLQGVTQREVLAPPDLEARYGVTEGHLYHGEHTLDQILFMRPVPGWGQYRTPVPGLYLCGAGTHPGGAIAGGPGRNAARAALKGEAAR
jgi:phytoene dehydrogenase-like protein